MSKVSRIVPIIWENNNGCCLKTFMINKRYSTTTNTINDHNDHDKSKLKRPIVTEKDVNPDSIDNSSNSIDNGDDFDEPANCCMSGCTNCVWLQYAEKLSEKLTNSSGDVQKIIMDKVTDSNMRAFLSMELRLRNIK
ncbi:uncharacterized protein LOC103580660 [Microplitis demolitor]|uniref:uncharacterized protein LOC103580660 n=1 Tax=Microplitis demolitor TaxID=69319 RepID=UPI0004CCA9A1|nr:uncharacterized protein LOC103580660 [Microplitis demolitor]